MSQQNLVSVQLKDQDLAEITKAIATLTSRLLPVLRSLKPEDRHELPKMGDKTVAFVQKTLEHCASSPELAPQFLNVAEFKADVAAVESLRALHGPLSQITDALSDTMLMAGSDAYAAALMYYSSVKSAKKSNVAKAGTIYDDLSDRFPGAPKKSASATK